MADFAMLDGSDQNIPYAATGAAADALKLSNPDNILSGQNRGTQSIGGTSNIQSDPGNQRIVVNDGNNNRVSFGRIGTGVNDWGLKVSKQGVQVDTATNDQLIFNSSQDVLKIVYAGNITVPAFNVASAGAGNYSYGQSSVSYAHNLGYVPVIIAYLNSFGNTSNPLPFSNTSITSAAQATWTNVIIQADSVAITFIYSVTQYGNVSNSVSNTPVKFYLLQETAI